MNEMKLEDNYITVKLSVQNANSENSVADQGSFSWLMIICILKTCCLMIYQHFDENLDLDNSRDFMD